MGGWWGGAGGGLVGGWWGGAGGSFRACNGNHFFGTDMLTVPVLSVRYMYIFTYYGGLVFYFFSMCKNLL